MQALSAGDFNLAEYYRAIWSATVDDGVKFEDVLAPEYWAHVAARLRPWARIEVRAVDGSFYAELLVKEAGRNWAKVFPIMHVQMDKTISQETKFDEDHLIAFKGPKRKWAVIRQADKAYIKEGFASSEDARRWLIEHYKALAA